MSETVTQQPENGAVEAASVQVDVLEQLLNPEVQKSLTVLVDNLPKLAEMVTLMTKAYDVATTVANDKVLMNDMTQGIAEFAKPITDKAKGIAAAAIEATDRAQADSSTIGLFGMLKMLKDPEVQRTLRFAQSFLSVLSERKSN